MANSAIKEISGKNNLNEKKNDLEKILRVEDIPSVDYYDCLAREKTDKIKKERMERNGKIMERQKNLLMSDFEKKNVEVDRNIKLIESFEKFLYEKRKNVQ